MVVKDAINRSVSDLLELPQFEEWHSGQRWDEGDLCFLNSSFLLRDGVKTNQSPRHLVLRAKEDGSLELVGATTFSKMRSPFKRFATGSGNLPSIQSIESAIEDEMRSLGEVLFILVSDLSPAAIADVDAKKLPGVEKVRLDSSQAAMARVSGDVITVRNTYDEAAIWDSVSGHFSDEKSVRPALAEMLEKLEDAATRKAVVPIAGTKPENPLLRELCSGLETQALEYQEALDVWTSSSCTDEGALHQILRISYNFASDAVRLIRLTVSICDLKPIVFWCTVKYHLALDTAIKSLPWQTQTKASLAAYVKIVNSARNHAFHDLFPVISGLHVDLPDAALRKVRLQLFSRHGSKKNRNEVRFEDQELVDLLTEFTRTGHRVTPPAFWKRNLDTMQASLDLLEATLDSLVLIRESMPS